LGRRGSPPPHARVWAAGWLWTRFPTANANRPRPLAHSLGGRAHPQPPTRALPHSHTHARTRPPQGEYNEDIGYKSPAKKPNDGGPGHLNISAPADPSPGLNTAQLAGTIVTAVAVVMLAVVAVLIVLRLRSKAGLNAFGKVRDRVAALGTRHGLARLNGASRDSRSLLKTKAAWSVCFVLFCVRLARTLLLSPPLAPRSPRYAPPTWAPPPPCS
jgi:hypothetical protein